MLDPWINWNEIKYSNQDLNVYLDNSKSIGSITSSVNFNAKMNYINNWGKDNDILINWYLFGDSIRVLDNKEKLFQDKISSLLGIKKNIVLDQKSNHMIISDGHINKGENFDNIIIDNNNIYISGFGKDIDNADCYISSVVSNRKNDNSLDLIINLGCFLNDIKNMSVEIILSNHKNNIIRSEKRTLKFNKNGFQDIVLENIDRNDLSIFNTVDIKTDLDELSYNNNRKHFVINEMQELKKVLLLSGGLSANTKFIMKNIENTLNRVLLILKLLIIVVSFHYIKNLL